MVATAGQQGLLQGEVAGDVVGVGDVPGPLAEQLSTVVAGDLAKAAVDPQPAPLRVDMGDPYGCLLERRLEVAIGFGGVAERRGEAAQPRHDKKSDRNGRNQAEAEDRGIDHERS